MLRVVLFLLAILALAAGLAWLADRPLLVTWQDYEIETSVFRAVVIFAGVFGLALLVWSLMRQIWSGIEGELKASFTGAKSSPTATDAAKPAAKDKN